MSGQPPPLATVRGLVNAVLAECRGPVLDLEPVPRQRPAAGSAENQPGSPITHGQAHEHAPRARPPRSGKGKNG